MFNVVDLDDGHRDVEVAEVVLVDDDDGDCILQAVVLELHIAIHIVYVALVIRLYNNVLHTQEVKHVVVL